MTRILDVVTNVAHYDDPTHPTGLWLSELTHAWDVFDEAGFEQTVVSPLGGEVPIEPRSLKPPFYDSSAKAWREDPQRMRLLESSVAIDDVDPADYDAIYLTGGHAVMYDFPESEGLERVTRELFETGGVVSAVCHGYCGLVNTRLTDGSYLVAGRRLTGFSWMEEVVAGVDTDVPYNIEWLIQQRGAVYEKTRIPFGPKVVVDGRLVTGQNPTSAKATARKVVEVLTTT